MSILSTPLVADSVARLLAATVDFQPKPGASFSQRDWDGTELCVGGQSAGGNLAAAASRVALENGGPRRAKDKPTPLGRAAVLRPWLGDVADAAYIPDPAQRRNRLASPAWGANGDGLVGIAPATAPGRA